mgnify:CR=1 FL=1|jgi:lysyl-tRNA synthetase class 2|tara:strand:- start:11815 stop:12804 length:990 start_codon:yes stop_codon:yes gene_type:complete
MDRHENGPGRSVLLARAELLQAIRLYFNQQDVLEVTTPTLGLRGVTDSQIQNLKLEYNDQSYYLQTSPEFAMKRLLASGSGSIFQICPAYRGSEQGRYHNTEFMMLEWYRVGYSLSELMDDVEQLLRFVTNRLALKEDKFRHPDRVSYEELFLQKFGIDPHRTIIEELSRQAELANIDCRHIVNHGDDGTLSEYLEVMFSLGIEPTLEKCTIVYDFPACQVALAQLCEAGGSTVARRFEVYVSGIELANGYLELGDASEVRAHMVQENELRAVRGLETVDLDERFLTSLSSMPECSGIALGLDRLLMVLLGKRRLSDVISFSLENSGPG